MACKFQMCRTSGASNEVTLASKQLADLHLKPKVLRVKLLQVYTALVYKTPYAG